MEETQKSSEPAKPSGVNDEEFQKIQGQMEAPSVNEANFILQDQKGQEVAVKLIMKEELILIQAFLYHAFWTLELNLEQVQKIHGIFCIDGSISEVFSHFQGYFTAKQVKLETVDQLIYLDFNEKYGNKEIKFQITLKQGESNVQQTLQTVSGQVFALEEQNKQLKERVNQLEEELHRSKFLAQSKLLVDKDVDLIFQWVSRKGKLPISTFNLLYRASAQGFKAQTFHQLCAEKSPLICFVQSQNLRRFGGYMDVKTKANQYGFIASNPNHCFLFSLDEKKQYLSNEDNSLSAYLVQPNYGFTIGGGHDLHLSNDCNINNKSYSALSQSYGKNQGGTQESLAGSLNFQVNEIEVYQVVFKDQQTNEKQQETITSV